MKFVYKITPTSVIGPTSICLIGFINFLDIPENKAKKVTINVFSSYMAHKKRITKKAFLLYIADEDNAYVNNGEEERSIVLPKELRGKVTNGDIFYFTAEWE